MAPVTPAPVAPCGPVAPVAPINCGKSVCQLGGVHHWTGSQELQLFDMLVRGLNRQLGTLHDHGAARSFREHGRKLDVFRACQGN